MYIWQPQPKDADFATMAILPWVIPTEPIQVMIDKLRIRLRGPIRFCAIAIENDRTQAVMVAYPGIGYCFLWQAHARRGFKYSRTMFEGLKTWARAKGLREIRMGTPDRKRAFQRRWGFESCEDYMRLLI